MSIKHINEDAIRIKAYYNWIARSCPICDAETDWYAAQAQLMGCDPQNNNQKRECACFAVTNGFFQGVRRIYIPWRDGEVTLRLISTLSFISPVDCTYSINNHPSKLIISPGMTHINDLNVEGNYFTFSAQGNTIQQFPVEQNSMMPLNGMICFNFIIEIKHSIPV